jgi:hypothetical protein
LGNPRHQPGLGWNHQRQEMRCGYLRLPRKRNLLKRCRGAEVGQCDLAEVNNKIPIPKHFFGAPLRKATGRAATGFATLPAEAAAQAGLRCSAPALRAAFRIPRASPSLATASFNCSQYRSLLKNSFFLLNLSLTITALTFGAAKCTFGAIKCTFGAVKCMFAGTKCMLAGGECMLGGTKRMLGGAERMFADTKRMLGGAERMFADTKRTLGAAERMLAADGGAPQLLSHRKK